jgi:phosphoheptose isomerase
MAGLIGEVAARVIASLERGGKVLLCGNGGSAADSQHIAAEFVNRFRTNRRGLAAIALTTDSSALTAVGNDATFVDVFARQVEALAGPNDVLIALSTSGNSANVLRAVDAAAAIGAATIGFTGRKGGALRGRVNLLVSIPADDTPRVQEATMMALHIVCSVVDRHYAGIAEPASGAAAVASER